MTAQNRTTSEAGSRLTKRAPLFLNADDYRCTAMILEVQRWQRNQGFIQLKRQQKSFVGSRQRSGVSTPFAATSRALSRSGWAGQAAYFGRPTGLMRWSEGTMRPDKNSNARLPPGEASNAKKTHDEYSTLIDRLRNQLLAGRKVSVIEQPRDTRPFVVAALAQLSDELPIRTTWRTIDRSVVNDTCLRARVFWIARGDLVDMGVEP
ncbi:hypothetical protein GO613_00435 [Azoarcus communis]|uniref:hypothetical protein n=1 Tax=Parazoarcus communis TaxID=41977 RepID=UPI0014597A13|nr:hypothetical protein [Parazoarcus communis]NMG46576.1 hypothetical protein [Parazoarcus communis]